MQMAQQKAKEEQICIQSHVSHQASDGTTEVIGAAVCQTLLQILIEILGDVQIREIARTSFVRLSTTPCK